MRLVLLTTDSPAQRALARRLDGVPELDLVGVAVQRLVGAKNVTWVRRQLLRSPMRVLDRVLQRLLFSSTIGSLARTEREVFGVGPWPDTRVCSTDDVNGHAVLELIASTRPDAVAVSGTRMVRAPVFDTNPPSGLYNLHTGLSPYYKGGPNCTLWCLANGDPAHLGVTVHVLDPGIDSGPILRTVRTPVTPHDTVADLVTRTIQVGHEAYVAVLRAIATGQTLTPVTQTAVGGRTYLSREWNVRHLARAVWFVRRGGLRQWLENGAAGSPSPVGYDPKGLHS